MACTEQIIQSLVKLSFNDSKPSTQTNLLQLLPLSTKIQIASYSGKVWYLLSKVDKQFFKYSQSAKGLKLARKLFGESHQKDQTSTSNFSFNDLQENVLYYAKYLSFYESNCYLLWCSDSFVLKPELGGTCSNHKIPVIKKGGLLYLSDLGENYIRDFYVTHAVIDSWFLSVHDKGSSHFFRTRIPLESRLPDIYRKYKIKNAPTNYIGYTLNWAFHRDGDNFWVNGEYTVGSYQFGTQDTLLIKGEKCVYVDSDLEIDDWRYDNKYLPAKKVSNLFENFKTKSKLIPM